MKTGGGAAHDGVNFIRGRNSLSRVKCYGKYHGVVPNRVDRLLLNGSFVGNFPRLGRGCPLRRNEQSGDIAKPTEWYYLLHHKNDERVAEAAHGILRCEWNRVIFIEN